MDINCYILGNYTELFSDEIYINAILKALQDILKFRVNYKLISEGNMEQSLEYLVNDNDVLLINRPTHITSLEDLPDGVDILFPVINDRLALLYKSSSIPVDKDLFVRNVTGNVWLYLGAVLVLLALCFRLSTNTHNRLKPKHSDWSWLEVIQWTLGAICQQGSAKYPQGCSCRTMFVIGYLITYMIYTGYAAGITSLLAVKADTTDLEWHKAMELHLPFLAQCNSEGDKYLKNMENDGHKRDILPCVNTIEELLREVEDYDIAAVTSEKSLAHYLTCCVDEDLRCKFSIAKQNRYTTISGILVKHNFVHKQNFNYWLLRFKENGLLARMMDQSQKPVPVCQTPAGYTETFRPYYDVASSVESLRLPLSLSDSTEDATS